MSSTTIDFFVDYWNLTKSWQNYPTVNGHHIEWRNFIGQLLPAVSAELHRPNLADPGSRIPWKARVYTSVFDPPVDSRSRCPT